MNILDVAKHANVAPKTASRVFNNNPSVRSYIRDRVLKSAKELNYRPNLLAKALRTNCLNVVSLMVRDLGNSFYGLLTQKLSARIAENFFEPIVCEDIYRVKRLNETLSSAGSIMLHPYNLKETLLLAKKQKIVTVMLDDNFGDIPNVTVDFYSAYLTLMKEAIKQGRKKIVYYYYHYGHYTTLDVSRKYHLLKKLSAQLGIEMETSEVSPKEMADYCLSSKFDIVICENDNLAVLFSHELLMQGIKPGQDILVVGCDAIIERPQGIWTLKVDLDELALIAVSLLMKYLNGEDVAASTVIAAEPLLDLNLGGKK